MATSPYPHPQPAVPVAQPLPAADVQLLDRNLERLARRRNAQRLWRSMAAALAWGVGGCVVLVLAYRFYLIDGDWWMLLPIMGVSLIVGYRNGRLQKRGTFEAAQDADRVLGLQDRLASALAFVRPQLVRRARLTRPGRSPLSRLKFFLLPRLTYESAPGAATTRLVPSLVHDAAARAASLDPKQIYPPVFDKNSKWLLGLGFVLAVLCAMPNIEWFRSVEQRRVAMTLQGQGKELQAIAKAVQKKEEQAPEVNRLSQRLQALSRKMQRGRMTKQAALTEIGKLRQELHKAVQNDSRDGTNSLSRVEQALRETPMESGEGRRIQEALQQRDLQKAAEQLEKLAAKVEKGDLKPDEREKAANDLQKAAQALRRQGGAQNEEAARQMEEAAKSLRQNKPQNQQSQQNQQGQSQQKQSGQNQQGQKGQGQKGQNQQNQQVQKGQGQQQGSQSGQRGGSQKQQSGQQGGGQNGQQSGQSGNGQKQGGANGSAGAADGLRRMAKGLREGGTQSGNSQSLREMLNKIEQAEKETGQNAGEQGDQPGQGKSGQSGNGQGQQRSLTPGKDLQVSSQGPNGGAGLGPRHGNQPHGSGGGVSKFKSKRTGDNRRWSDVWSDRVPATQKKLSRITGKMGSQGETEQLPTRTEAKGGSVNTPYYEVYESYKKDAEDAVSKDAVPPAYKQPVKNYFESLKP